MQYVSKKDSICYFSCEKKSLIIWFHKAIFTTFRMKQNISSLDVISMHYILNSQKDIIDVFISI